MDELWRRRIHSKGKHDLSNRILPVKIHVRLHHSVLSEPEAGQPHAPPRVKDEILPTNS